MAGIEEAVEGVMKSLGITKDTCDANLAKPPPDVPEDGACPNEGITDCGIQKAAKWKSLLNGAILVYNTYNSLRMAKLQRDLGEKYLELSEEQHKYYNDRYKNLEIKLTDEALHLEKYKRDKDPLYTGQMLVSARGKNAGQLDRALSCTGRYCTGLRASLLTDGLLQQATTESLAAGLAYRYADAEEMNFNNRRWDMREQVMRIGRELPTEAISYANIAANTFGNLGKQAGLAAEGAMQFLGANRNPTMYPTPHAPLTTPAYKYTPSEIPVVPEAQNGNFRETNKSVTISLAG